MSPSLVARRVPSAPAFISVVSALCLAVTLAAPAAASHRPCGEPANVGGGTADPTLAHSPDPAMGWDVGGGQCNGDFTAVTAELAGGTLELGIRAEERRQGQVPNDGGDYTVQPGPDPGSTRAWWNFQMSAAADFDLTELDALWFDIQVDEGSAVATNVPFDLLADCADFGSPGVALVDCFNTRNSDSSATSFSDHWQISQNPIFGWLGDGMGGNYDFNEADGAWFFTLHAEKDGEVVEATACFHTPGSSCGLRLAIDVRPNNEQNQINTRANQLVPIAVLGSADFDPCDPFTGVDDGSDEFDARGAAPSESRTVCEDVNGDGFIDKVMYFRARDMEDPTDEECAADDQTITVRGTTFDGKTFVGSDSVTWLNCN